MYNQFVIFVTFHILQGKVATFLKVWWKLLHVPCSKFSQLSNSEKKLKIFQQLTKLPSAMQCLPFWTTL